MRKVKGFSLIECCIYIFILGIITSLAFKYTLSSVMQCAKGRQLLQQYCTEQSIMRLIAKDIQMALPEKNNWEPSNALTLVGTCSNFHFAWQLKGESLYRSMGTYDFFHKRWIKRSESLIAQAIQSFNYTLVEQMGVIQSIEIMVEIANRKIIRSIALYNGSSL